MVYVANSELCTFGGAGGAGLDGLIRVLVNEECGLITGGLVVD